MLDASLYWPLCLMLMCISSCVVYKLYNECLAEGLTPHWLNLQCSSWFTIWHHRGSRLLIQPRGVEREFLVLGEPKHRPLCSLNLGELWKYRFNLSGKGFGTHSYPWNKQTKSYGISLIQRRQPMCICFRYVSRWRLMMGWRQIVWNRGPQGCLFLLKILYILSWL